MLNDDDKPLLIIALLGIAALTGEWWLCWFILLVLMA